MRSTALQEELNGTLTMADLANQFGVSLMTIHNWRVKRGLPAIVMPGTKSKPAIRFIPMDVEKWEKHNQHVIFPKTGRPKKIAA